MERSRAGLRATGVVDSSGLDKLGLLDVGDEYCRKELSVRRA